MYTFAGTEFTVSGRPAGAWRQRDQRDPDERRCAGASAGRRVRTYIIPTNAQGTGLSNYTIAYVERQVHREPETPYRDGDGERQGV